MFYIKNISSNSLQLMTIFSFLYLVNFIFVDNILLEHGGLPPVLVVNPDF